MLNHFSPRRVFWVAYGLILTLQCWLAWWVPLFADEAFYWLEGQHLDWSYTEVPGLIPWLLALSESLLPHQPFFLRILSLLMFAALPWMTMHLHNMINPSSEKAWWCGILTLCLPLLGLAGVMAIPDIWLVGFSVLGMIALVQAIKEPNKHYFILLGFILILGVNTHIRFWIIATLAGIITLWMFRKDKQIIMKLLGIPLPLLILGMVPLALFNVQHDFPLLAFQAEDRHPWSFQKEHLYFFPIQLLVTTPVLFLLLFKTATSKQTGTIQQLLLMIAVVHWLVYAVLGFFTDSTRFSAHWPLFSYVILIALTQPPSRWLKSAIYSGLLIHGLFLGYLIHGNTTDDPDKFQSRLLNNAMGWPDMADKTLYLWQQHQHPAILADHFMTAATLRYHMPANAIIEISDHPLNHKHGRADQISIMGLNASSDQSGKLVVFETTALKPEQRAEALQSLCEQHNGLLHLDELKIKHGIQVFQFFISGQGSCDSIPSH